MLIEAVIAVSLVLLAWLFFRENDPIDHLPGPPRLPLIGNTHQMIMISKGKLLEAMIEYTKTYGDRFLINVFGVRTLHISSPSDIEIMLSHSKNIKKSMIYDFVIDWLGDGLLLGTGSQWHKRRKVLTPAFHFNILKNFATVIEERATDLVQLLKEKKGADVDVMAVISDCTLLIICETAMGTKLDADTVEYKNAILDISRLILNRLAQVWLWSDLIYKNSSEGKRYKKNLETARAFAENVIQERKAHKADKIEEVIDEEFGKKRRLAMLDLLLEAEAKGQMDMQGIRDEVNTFMFAGHDTTAAAITLGLMLLADHDDIQERILMEIQSVVKDSDRPPTIHELADMKYLEAVIKEILRIYPPVPFIGRRVEEDFMLEDLPVKKGTTVAMHIYDLHHREDIYPDPEAFKPDRFLGADLKYPFAYVPFSAGPRNCIGQKFAMQEMKKVFSEIVRNFKLKPNVKDARPKLIAEIVLRPSNPIYIKFIPRA